ncbi:hypothetical protein ACFQ1S_07670 [Kibdelosporangium lantanae]|uniref:Uncharacterized protein n=1 Tax=Kibdelosporangium lantanae TaxID=1497396 RepID=A0ABW3M4D0_9PSEU
MTEYGPLVDPTDVPSWMSKLVEATGDMDNGAFRRWGPPPGTTPDTVLCVGEWDADYLHRFWSDVREVEPITLPGGLLTEETAHHAAIYLCRQPHGGWAELWPGLRHLD